MIAPVLPVYTRPDLVFERGEGAWLIAEDGKRYLDFTAGVAVNALGHAHPKLVEALTEQAKKVWHISNLFRHAGQRAAGAAAGGRDLRRHGVLHQLRRRGDGVRDQDGAPLPVRRRPSGASSA